MRNIGKRKEPNSLVTYRAKSYASFEGLPSQVDNDIREGLLQEQGFICCYCMSRIHHDSMKIEHWHCQSRYSNEQLAYRNMLAACYGNQGQPPGEQHCDTKKGNCDLVVNPANLQHDVESRLKYRRNGKIESTDVAFNGQINDILNLNFSRLKSNRKAVVVAVEEVLNTQPGTRIRSQIERLISEWDSLDGNGTRKPFCAIAIFFLNARLRRA